MNNLQLFKFFLNIWINLKWKWRNIRLIWVYHGDIRQTQSWKFRRLIEKILAKHSLAVACECKDSINCISASTLGITKEKVMHVSEADFTDSLIGLIHDYGFTPHQKSSFGRLTICWKKRS